MHLCKETIFYSIHLGNLHIETVVLPDSDLSQWQFLKPVIRQGRGESCVVWCCVHIVSTMHAIANCTLYPFTRHIAEIVIYQIGEITFTHNSVPNVNNFMKRVVK